MTLALSRPVTLAAGSAQRFIAQQLLEHHVPVQRASWQGTNAPSPAYEATNVLYEQQVPDSINQWEGMCDADTAWAEEHFQERVGGRMLNPTPSYVRWPWHNRANAEKFIRDGGRFDHTYPERYWPHDPVTDRDAGDLEDVVRLLRRDVWTRQAYLPVWFPEDTGAVRSQRVPCTLGYHFIRNGPQLDCNYFLRSCDLTRHFKNDVYLTGRLLQWMVEQVGRGSVPYPGKLTIFISNLHLFTNDAWRFQANGGQS